jgi:NADH dehydrogenase [ubiquinone] 1 alpha subcomplex assembly factor 1
MKLLELAPPDRWEIVNDTVMGGVSQAHVTASGDGHLVFSGDVSLANRGGFASARGWFAEQDLSACDRLHIRVRGDGRRYALTLRTDVEVRAGSYRVPFVPPAGAWHETDLPFADFVLTSFGEPVAGAPPLNPAHIRSVGLLIGGGQAGPFRIELAAIDARPGSGQ